MITPESRLAYRSRGWSPLARASAVVKVDGRALKSTMDKSVAQKLRPCDTSIQGGGTRHQELRLGGSRRPPFTNPLQIERKRPGKRTLRTSHLHKLVAAQDLNLRPVGYERSLTLFSPVRQRALIKHPPAVRDGCTRQALTSTAPFALVPGPGDGT